MVMPTAVTAKLIELINNNKSNYSFLVTPIEGSEDTTPQSQPNSVIYSDFDETAELDSKRSYPTRLPCSIYIAYTSKAYATANQAFNDAFNFILTVLKIISENDYLQCLNTDNELEHIHLELQTVPITILRKSAAGTTIQLELFYDIKI